MPTLLEDRQSIADVFISYCDALDRKEWERLEDLFVENLTTDWYQGRWTQYSRNDAITFIRSWVEPVDAHHIIGNHVATITGDTAHASCKVQAHHAGKGAKAGMFEETLGEYSGHLIRASDARYGWRFTHYQEVLSIVLGSFNVFDRS
jgi:hypothetical protein